MESKSIRATREEVELFLSCSVDYGFGSGSNFCNGCGSYDCDGFGYGSSPNSGCDDCSGFGFDASLDCGDGEGHGYANCIGCDDCSGIGYGSNYGSGFFHFNGSVYGVEGIKTFSGHATYYIDGFPIIIDIISNNIASGYIINLDLTLSPCYIAKVGNSLAHGKTVREAFIDATAKEMRRMENDIYGRDYLQERM